ncbi:hypothetical protein, partial [Corynebacterium singulare]
ADTSCANATYTMTENREPYHLSGKPRPTTRIAPTNYAETALGRDFFIECVEHLVRKAPRVEDGICGNINHGSAEGRHSQIGKDRQDRFI